MLQLVKFQEGKHSGRVFYGHVTRNIIASVWFINNLLEGWCSSVFLGKQEEDLSSYDVVRDWFIFLLYCFP